MILVGATLTHFAMSAADPMTWRAWLTNAEAIAASVEAEVRYAAVIELDARGLDPFVPLLDELCTMEARGVPTDWWTYHLDDRRERVQTGNRLHHITTGRNLLTDMAVNEGAEWLFYMDADTEHPPDVLPKLLEVRHPLVGAHVPTYCLDGPQDTDRFIRGMDVRRHMNTAGSCLAHRDLFRRLRWRHDPDAGMTDDPCWHADAERLGVPWLVRHDVLARHHPESIPPIEQRGHDLEVAR